jgi:hypothetical protein
VFGSERLTGALTAGHILRAGEFQHEGLVQRRNGGEVTYFRKLIRLARDADGDRPEIREARQFAVVK